MSFSKKFYLLVAGLSVFTAFSSQAFASHTFTFKAPTNKISIHARLYIKHPNRELRDIYDIPCLNASYVFNTGPIGVHIAYSHSARTWTDAYTGILKDGQNITCEVVGTQNEVLSCH